MNRSVWFILAVVFVGCNHGPEVAPVSGHVTLDGKPLSLAEVTFEPKEGRTSHGHTDANGQYDLRYTREKMGALVGSHTVRILSDTEVTLPNGKFVLRPQMVPPKYNTHSELHRDVESGTQNVFDFELKSGSKK